MQSDYEKWFRKVIVKCKKHIAQKKTKATQAIVYRRNDDIEHYELVVTNKAGDVFYTVNLGLVSEYSENWAYYFDEPDDGKFASADVVSTDDVFNIFTRLVRNLKITIKWMSPEEMAEEEERYYKSIEEEFEDD